MLLLLLLQMRRVIHRRRRLAPLRPCRHASIRSGLRGGQAVVVILQARGGRGQQRVRLGQGDELFLVCLFVCGCVVWGLGLGCVRERGEI